MYFGEAPKKSETSETDGVTDAPKNSATLQKQELIFRYDNKYLWLINRKWKRFSLCYLPAAYYTAYLFLNESLSLLGSDDLLPYLSLVAFSTIAWGLTRRSDAKMVHGMVIQRNFQKLYFVVDRGLTDSKQGYVKLQDILSEDLIKTYGFERSAWAAEVDFQNMIWVGWAQEYKY